MAFFPPPDADGALWFRVLLGAPKSDLTVIDAVEVGTFQLPSGGIIGVCMRPGPMSPTSAAKIRGVRAQMLRAVTVAGARRC